MKAIALLLSTLLLGTPLSSRAAPAEAANRLDQILARGSVRVAITSDYKPFSYRDPAGGGYEGSDAELAGMLAQSLGVKLEWVATSWPTLMDDFADNTFDIAVGGISISLERQKRALFSIPYLRDGKTPITRCENLARFQSLAQIDRPEVRLVVNPGGTNERFARANATHARIALHPDNVTIFDEIIAGRADLMITDAVEARLQQRLRPQLCAVHPDTPFDFSEKAFLLPRDVIWKAWVDQWLHQSLENGSLRRVQDKWLAWPWSKGAALAGPDALLALMDERLALMPDVARHKWNIQAAIEDLPRERAIIAALARQAAEAGVPAAWAESFFKAQIEAAKTVQRDLFERWRQQKAGRFEQVPDLARELRPRLDALTPLLLKALTQNWAALSDPAQRAQWSAAAQNRLPPAAWGAAAAQAAAPLTDGSASRR
ncbi:gamma subclass chorismate mutase AroQ [Rugamonas sp. CCM 8940]|nr:gamma subclass chorismate mutase AroQ [Rugamonas sp. CCM 8940]MBJ7313786.1 gamma subclass chorismate mutase AroQ [Rugamonas sp. CCM 8940]